VSADPLDTVQVRYATWRDAPLEERGTVLDEPDGAAPERVVLETCHRVEVVTAGAAVPARGPDTVVGREAVRRVFAVAAGFDSAVIAEEQLLGQDRAAYEAALAAGTTGPILNELFRRALRFGRRVRSHATPGTDRSLADPAVAWLRARLDDGARVLVAGTGEMGRLVATSLARGGHPVTIASRALDRGERLASGLPGRGHGVHLGELTAELVGHHAAVVLAVRRARPLLVAAALGRARPWTLDLSTPPMVDRVAAERLGERLLDVDRLGSLAGRSPAIPAAAERRLRRELEDEVARFATWLATRDTVDALALLHGRASDIRRRHLARVARRAALSAEQLAAVEAATAAIVGELLHAPSIELRRGGADAAAVARLFGVER
jgi:glutamyl-tRNA reductase